MVLIWVQWKAGVGTSEFDRKPQDTWRRFKSRERAAAFYDVKQSELGNPRRNIAPASPADWDVRNEKPAHVGDADIVDMTGWPPPAPVPAPAPAPPAPLPAAAMRPAAVPAATAHGPPTKRQRTDQSPRENNPLEQAQSDLKKDKVLEFKNASEQQYKHKIASRDSLNSELTKAKDTVKKVKKDLEDLRRKVSAKEKLEKEAIAKRDKLEAAWTEARCDIQTLIDRRCSGRPNEPLDGIYVDLVEYFDLDTLIKQVFDGRKEESMIYVGTAEGPGVKAAKGRKKDHDKTFGNAGDKNSAIMRLIHVTDYAHAGGTEKQCIRFLKDHAENKNQINFVGNSKAGGGGIHKGKPYHFIYIYYTPQQK